MSAGIEALRDRLAGRRGELEDIALAPVAPITKPKRSGELVKAPTGDLAGSTKPAPIAPMPAPAGSLATAKVGAEVFAYLARLKNDETRAYAKACADALVNGRPIPSFESCQLGPWSSRRTTAEQVARKVAAKAKRDAKK